MYACDHAWWVAHINEVNEKFYGKERYTHAANRNKFNAVHVPGVFKPGLGKDGIIHLGGNSGYQAINLAYLMSAKEINLTGFDMQRTYDMSHWHGDHPKSCSNNSPFASWLKNFDQLALDLKNENVKVVNYTRKTALECFEKGDLCEL